jgi:hypothetical protein
MRKLTLSKIVLLVLIVLSSSNAMAAPARPALADAPELRITARDNDRVERLLARLKRFTRLIVLSIDMIPPSP